MSDRLRPVKTAKGYVIHDQGNQRLFAELPECNVGYVQELCDVLNNRGVMRNYSKDMINRLCIKATRFNEDQRTKQ